MGKGWKIGLGVVGALIVIGLVAGPPAEEKRGEVAEKAITAPAAQPVARPQFVTSLTDAQHEERARGCFADHAAWRNRGVIKYGGAKPGIEREVWDELTDEEKTQIIEVAACLQAGALPGEQFVSVEAAGSRGTNLETRRTPNTHRLPQVAAAQ